RKTDGNALENSDLASLVVLKKTDASGDNVPFAATIDDSKKIITITPSASLDNSQLYYLAVGAVEDMSGNETTGSNITFTTVSASAATVTITAPTGGETYYAGQNVDLTWTSANVDNVKIEAWVVDSDRTYKWETLVETMPAASGLLNFDIPGDALYGTGYQIRISDASNASLSSTSGNFTIIAVATSLTDLKTRCIVNDIVKISSEVTVTFLRSSANRNQKYIQDSGAGLLIDDASSVLTTPLAVGDNIQNLEGKLGYYNGMNQIVPTKATVSVASSGNTPVVTTVTIAEFTGSFDPYEARLIKLVNVNFPTADGSATFGSEKTYDLSDGVNTVKFFTFEAPESDIVGTVIPSGNYDVTGLAMRYNTTVEIASRTLNDLSLVTGIENALQRDDIRLYPVPASSQLNLSNVPGLRSVEVLDIAGKVIRTINTSSDEVIGIPVSGLTRGTYILKINTTEGTMVRRFVKQ
ncbi:MAG: T9SS type A sorting domain-containing protein, partial [Bacteroidales bacterium]|nr:T9SS type A sorting domain-containing protein [Bacteroidales bacterium]